MTQMGFRNDLDLAGAEVVSDAAGVPPTGAVVAETVARRRPVLGDPTMSAAALFAGDAAAFVLGASLLAGFGSLAGQTPAVLSLLAATSLLLCWSEGLYPGYGVYPHEILRRRLVVFAKVGLVATSGSILLTAGWHLPAVVLAFLLLSLMLQMAARALVRSALARSGRWGIPVAVEADAKAAEAICRHLDLNWQIGLRCAGPRDAWRDGGAPAVAVIPGLEPGPGRLDLLRGRFAEVIAIEGVPSLRGSGLRPGDLGGEIGLRLRPAPSSHQDRGARALDLAVGGLGLILSGPILLIAAAAIYAADPGPIIYRQTREGLGGRPFGMLKLRTMYRDADRRLDDLLATDAAIRSEWFTHYKLRHDPRVLPMIGNLLRCSSVDELPQLVNVVRGDMRVVGPRPFPLYHLDAMDPDFRVRRCTVPPGLTGLWQISGRSTADLARQQELDDFYIDNRSFWFDLHILIGTVRAVFRGHGAY